MNEVFSTENQRRPSDAPQSGGHLLSLPKILTRGRLNSVLTRPIEGLAASPLAQVFNPLPVCDDAPDSKAGPQGISFGPATRRRLTSTQPYQKSPSEHSQLHSNQMKKFPNVDDIDDSPHQGNTQAVTHKPNSALTATKVKANEFQDDASDKGVQVTMMRRLDEIEQRQERIEDLLFRISQSIGVTRKH